jgi:alcohol dehydrogenase (cytochrome c)
MKKLLLLSLFTVLGFAQPVTDKMLAEPDPADWLMWRRTLNSWGYSPLNQVTRANVAKLKQVWESPMGPGIQEATPLVHNGVMYLPNPSDYIQALDAATGKIKWEYKREVPNLQGFIPVPSINRNLAIYGETIIDTSQDDFVFALNTADGKLAWETRILDYREDPAQQTSGPIIANGKVFSTRGCEVKFTPQACIVTAHDAKTGKELWRTRLIPKPGEPGDESWGDVKDAARRHVGAWMVPSFDAATNQLIVGTSVTAPAPKYKLAGNDKQYLYHNSTLALNADTGKINWYYQHVVDHWDLDHPFERLLLDTAVAPDAKEVAWINPNVKKGERRRVVTGIPGKTGIIYTLDLKTGEFLWARPTVFQNVVKDIDGKTGKVTVNPETLFEKDGDKRFVCPSASGGKDYPAGAYSPRTNAMYYGLANLCQTITSVNSPNSAYGFSGTSSLAPNTENAGTLFAVSAETGKTIWRHDQRAGLVSAVATGGGLIFIGDANGHFKAFNDETGQVLWDVDLQNSVTGFPITYMVNGKQYVAVSLGNALTPSSLARLTPELKTGTTNKIVVFALSE